MMRNTAAIARRELASYFNSPVAYLVIAAFLGISSYFYFDNLWLSNQADLRDFFASAPFLFIPFAPAITMRLLAEERRSGTIAILITLPIRDSEVILGKFLAAWGLFIAILALTLTIPL